MIDDARATKIGDYALKALAEGSGGDLVRSVAADIAYLCGMLNRAEAERDAYKRVVDAYRIGRTVSDSVQRHRFYAECHEQRHEITMMKQDLEIAASLEAMPEMTP